VSFVGGSSWTNEAVADIAREVGLEDPVEQLGILPDHGDEVCHVVFAHAVPDIAAPLSASRVIANTGSVDSSIRQ